MLSPCHEYTVDFSFCKWSLLFAHDVPSNSVTVLENSKYAGFLLSV